MKKQRQYLQVPTLFLISIFALISCSNRRDFETYIAYTGISFIDPYKIDSIQQCGFMDWSLDAFIVISEQDKYNILGILKSQTNFYPIDSEKSVLNNINNQKDSIIGYISGQTYYYSYYKPRFELIKDELEYFGFETFIIRIDTVSNKLIFNYFYE